MRSRIWPSGTTVCGAVAGARTSTSTRIPRRSAGRSAIASSRQRLVEAGRAHAALVFDGDVAVAWAQFGTVPELPNIHHRKEWEQGVARMPDYRITCLFVDREYRRAQEWPRSRYGVRLR